MHWYQAIAEHAQAGRAYVIATVLATAGSTPRAASTKMVIGRDASADSIGGGELERLVVEHARTLLDAGRSAQEIHHFPLAAAALQCCGGSVTVLFECQAPSALRVVVFGAGHVGSRVVTLLADLDAQIDWYDARVGFGADGPVACTTFDDPEALVDTLDPDREMLVLTHDHRLDYALVHALLARGCERIGLIGSATKRERFAARLADAGCSDEQIARIRCPVGHPSVPGKQPMAVAIAITAELLGRSASNAPESPSDLSWRQVKAALLRSETP